MAAERRLRPEREAPELGDMLERMLRALVRRATAGELDALGELARLRVATSSAIALAALGAHDGPGHYSWTEIARELGVTRQAARQLYGGAFDPDATI